MHVKMHVKHYHFRIRQPILNTPFLNKQESFRQTDSGNRQTAAVFMIYHTSRFNGSQKRAHSRIQQPNLPQNAFIALQRSAKLHTLKKLHIVTTSLCISPSGDVLIIHDLSIYFNTKILDIKADIYAQKREFF